MKYIPPHLRPIELNLEDPKKIFTETCNAVQVTTNTPYGVLDSLNSLSCAKLLTYNEPTVIQKYAIPAVLKGHPLQCRAPTGMGKTMCFLLPLVEHITNDETNPFKRPCSFDLKSFGLKVCIISPTRELCEQIKEEGLKIDPKLSISCLYGGFYSKFNANTEILVAAPGKLLNYLENKKIDFKKIQSFVLDEADKLLEMGFEQDIRAIKAYIPESASVFLFSATFPKNLNQIINDFLPKNKITIEIQNEILTTIKQVLLKVKNKDEKLKELLEEMYPKEDRTEGDWSTQVSDEAKKQKSRILIFGEKKVTVSSLEHKISSWGYACESIHGDKEQTERQRALNKYKSGDLPILIATSVAARGIDVKDIHMVINYDFPRDAKEYIHRIGRTGRQGKKGTAVSFVAPGDLSNPSMNAEIIEILKESKNEIPDFLMGESGHAGKDKKDRFKEKESVPAFKSLWRNSSSTSERPLQSQFKQMTLNSEKESSTATDQNNYLSTEKEDADEDLAGGW